MPHGEHHVTDFDFVAVGKSHGGQVLGLHLDHGHIRLRIAADHLAVELASIGQADFDRAGVFHHVVVGEDVAVLGHDDAGAHALLSGRMALRGTALLLEFLRHLEARAKEAAQVKSLGHLHRADLGLAGDRDLHHAGCHGFNNGRKAREAPGCGGQRCIADLNAKRLRLGAGRFLCCGESHQRYAQGAHRAEHGRALPDRRVGG